MLRMSETVDRSVQGMIGLSHGLDQKNRQCVQYMEAFLLGGQKLSVMEGTTCTLC